MDISQTSNMFICLAEARLRAGDDMEEVARDLAVAFQAVVNEGIGTAENSLDIKIVMSELRRFAQGA